MVGGSNPLAPTRKTDQSQPASGWLFLLSDFTMSENFCLPDYWPLAMAAGNCGRITGTWKVLFNQIDDVI
ncbi:MAG TPA: hypothetical protein VIU93_05670 [Gallionellaceae bacterium]